jgi:hypothetical protein
VNIAVEILRPDPPRPGKKSLYVATVSLTAIAAMVMTYAVMSRFGLLSKSSPPEQKSAPASTQPISPAQPEASIWSRSLPSAPTNLPKPAQQVAPAPLDSGLFPKSSQPAPTSPPAPSQQVAPVPLSQEPAREAREEISRVPPKIQPPAESKIPKIGVSSPDGSATTLPSLKISAIVWYEERSKRFAMVNGVIANEGSVVEGVKVEEIYPDRVRFSHNGRPFEIPIK